jgi:hypothetical protein
LESRGGISAAANRRIVAASDGAENPLDSKRSFEEEKLLLEVNGFIEKTKEDEVSW